VRPRVVKVGGNLADDAGWMRQVAAGIAATAHLPTVVVHGGGKEVSELQRSLGIEPEWRDGLRVTTPEVLRIVRLVLSGSVNKRWVAALLDAGADAVGISGEDGALLGATFSQGGALGRTGEVVRVRAELLQGWLAQGLTPVVSPVSRGPDGEGLNVNADAASAAVAAALGAGELLFLSDVPGVRRAGEWLDRVDGAGAEALLASGEAAGGMRPKLRAALRAAGGGAERVRIGDVEMLADDNAGTLLTLEAVHAGC